MEECPNEDEKGGRGEKGKEGAMDREKEEGEHKGGKGPQVKYGDHPNLTKPGSAPPPEPRGPPRATASTAAPTAPNDGRWEAAPGNEWLNFNEPPAQPQGWAYGSDQGWQQSGQVWQSSAQQTTQYPAQQWVEGGAFLPTLTATGGGGGWHDDQGWLLKGKAPGKGGKESQGWQGWQDHIRGKEGSKGGKTYAREQAQGKTQAQGKRGADGKGGKEGKKGKYGEVPGDRGVWL